MSADDALQGIPPELMLVEAMAQVGGSIVFTGGERGFLTGVDEVVIVDAVDVGDKIDLQVTLDVEMGGLFRLRGRAMREGSLIVSARFYLASTQRVDG